MKIVILFVAILVFVQGLQQEKIRFRVEYENIFTQKSDVTAVFVVCTEPSKFKLSLQSFLYFNTKLLNKLIIIYCTSQNRGITESMPYNFDRYQYFVQLKFRQDSKTMIQTLEEVYKSINTKYVYQSNGQWQTIKGYGFIEQAIMILDHREKENKNTNYSQVLASFPMIRDYCHLKPMQWTKEGIAFHQIYAFKPETYEYFTFSPSLFDLKLIFHKVLNRNLRNVAEKQNCGKQSIHEYDKCSIWAIGQYLHQNGYSQIYLNDGKDESNLVLLKN